MESIPVLVSCTLDRSNRSSLNARRKKGKVPAGERVTIMKAAIATATLLFVGAASECLRVQCVRLTMDQRIFVHVHHINSLKTRDEPHR